MVIKGINQKMKHSSAKDLWLVLAGITQFFLLLFGFLQFRNNSSVVSVFFELFLISYMCMNFQCIAHNFIHNIFFKSKILNWIFSSFNSLLIGVPQTLYKFHHLNHHRFNNDTQDEKGETGDLSSLFRFSKVPKKEENIFTYSFIGPIRTDFFVYIKEAIQAKLGKLLIAETVTLLLFWGILLYIDPRTFLLFYIPIWYLGQVLAYAENYFEHFDAIPGNRLTDSVSCYDPIYNFLWFNNGYHQEHHLKPTIHWSEIPQVERLMLPRDARKTVNYCHMTNWYRRK